MTDGGRRIRADRIEVDRLQNKVTADGAVMFDDVRVEIAEPEAVGPTWVAELVHALRRRG